jgi:transposase
VSNKLKMADISSIQTLLQRGWSQRRIARELGVNRETVARYAAALDPKPAISTAGSCAEKPPDLTAGLVAVDSKPAISTAGVAGRKSLCDAVADVINEKLDLGLSAQRIHQDLVSEHEFAGSYESVKRFVQRINRKVPLPFRRMECAPGEQAQVDFGQGALTTKPGCKRKVRPHLLRIVLSFSRKAYSEVVWRQTTEDFIRAIENAFWRFGGVPKVLIIDNLRAAVVEADWFDPTITPKFQAFARHYGFVVLPTKPYTPRHKGKVEAGVKYVQENAVKAKEFDSLADQNAHLADWERRIADQRIHGTTRKHVSKLFEEHEHKALLPLPAERFPFFHEAGRTVHRDGHIEVDKAFYSVPPEFVGRPVWARWDSRLVRVFDERFNQIAVHTKIESGRFSTQGGHIASEKMSAAELGTAHLLERAAKIGPEAARWSQALISARGIEGVRVLQGFLSLATQHPWKEIERVCLLAVSHGAFRLKSLRHLLKHTTTETVQVEFLEAHPLIRDPADYGCLVHDAFLFHATKETTTR